MSNRIGFIAALILILSPVAGAQWPPHVEIGEATATAGVEVLRIFHDHADHTPIDSDFQQLAYGDFNGDGHDDLAMGIPRNAHTGYNRIVRPEVLIYYGGPHVKAATIDIRGLYPYEPLAGMTRIVGYNDTQGYYPFGHKIDSADFDRDGCDDLVALNGDDAIYIFYGSPELRGTVIDLAILASSRHSRLELFEPVNILHCEDINNDDYPEILLTGGRDVTMISGLELRSPTRTRISLMDMRQLRSSFGDFAVGDLNGDGRKDMFTVSNGHPYSRILLGNDRWFDTQDNYNPDFPEFMETIDLVFAEGYNGHQSGIGDMDGDGIADAVYNNYYSGYHPLPHQGTIGLLFGETSFASQLVVDITPANNEARFIDSYPEGMRTVLDIEALSVDDVNGDGLADVLASRSNLENEDEPVYLIFGRPDLHGAVADIPQTEHVSTIHFGDYRHLTQRSLAGDGDLNGDGRPDVAIMSPLMVDFETKDTRGLTYILLGQGDAASTPRTRAVIAGNPPAVDFGPVVRAEIDHATGSFSRDRITLHRTAPANTTAAALPVHWELATARTPLNATLTFHYTDNELGDRDESLLTVWHWPEGGAGWRMLPSTVDAQRNEITVTGVTEPGLFAVGEGPELVPDTADFNSDGRVDTLDLFILAANWHRVLAEQAQD